jgi:tetratricopeptide (TPR) repeat protein
MNSANESSASTPSTSSDTGRTSIQAVPPPPESPQPASAKSKRKRLTVEGLQRIVARLDGLTVVLVLLLTFLLSSFAARNTDLWLHVATGRAMLQEHSFLQKDPFSFTAEGPWVNHSWLLDLIVYGIFQWTGGTNLENPDLSLTGPVLIGAKAMLMVILAWVLMSIRRPGQSVWLPAGFTALTMVVLSRWVSLQPKVISFLFLGLTLFFLQRPRGEAGEYKFVLSRPIIAIPLLFLLWVNLDEWFILGPITVALYLIGELAQQFLMPLRTGEDAPPPGHLGRLATLLAVGLVACLVNPHFYRAFQVPAEIWPWLNESPLQLDDTYTLQLKLFQSPFSEEELTAVFSKNPSSADIAYYLLAALGLASFALNWADWRGWRIIIWLAFFMLSARLMRTIPFFAVVAGPITALNIQDFAARRYGVGLRLDNPWKSISIVGRLATVTAGILLLVAAWPGLLHARYDDSRSTHHASWQIEVNSSLQKAALRLQELRLAGAIGDGSGLNLSHEIANYFAWFCPEEKSFFDNRFPLFDKVAASYVDTRDALNPRRETSQSPEDQQQIQQQLQQQQQKEFDRRRKLQKTLLDHHINHLTVSGLSFQQIAPVVLRLWRDPSHWKMVYMDGRTAIFGWIPPRSDVKENPFAAYEFRPEALAYGPNPPPEWRAPSSSPGEGSTVWRELWIGPVPRSIHADESAMLVNYSDTLKLWQEYYHRANEAAWQILSLGGPMGTAFVANLPGQISLAIQFAGFSSRFTPMLYFDPRPGPSAASLLAIRAARRAVAENPRDAQAYLELATAIQYYWESEEANWRAGSELKKIRRIQQLAALRKALALKPDSIEAHLRLARAYSQPEPPYLPFGIIDLASEHFHKALELNIAAGPNPKESQDDFKKRIDQLQASIKNLDDQSKLERAQSEYQLAIRQSSSLARRAAAAVSRGLYQQALTVLIDNEEAIELEPNEARLALNLLIEAGRLDDARAQAQDIQDAQVRFNIAVGIGDYAQADQALADNIRSTEKAGVESLLFLVRNSTWARPFAPNGQPLGMGPEFLGGFRSSAQLIQSWADSWVVRGVLALEAGDTVRAEQYLRHALQLGQSGAKSDVGVPFTFSGQALARHYLNMLENAKEQTAKKEASKKTD